MYFRSLEIDAINWQALLGFKTAAREKGVKLSVETIHLGKENPFNTRHQVMQVRAIEVFLCVFVGIFISILQELSYKGRNCLITALEITRNMSVENKNI